MFYRLQQRIETFVVASDGIIKKLANYYSFPYGLSLIELKKYESMDIHQRLYAAAEMEDKIFPTVAIFKYNIIIKNAKYSN